MFSIDKETLYSYLSPALATQLIIKESITLSNPESLSKLIHFIADTIEENIECKLFCNENNTYDLHLESQSLKEHFHYQSTSLKEAIQNAMEKLEEKRTKFMLEHQDKSDLSSTSTSSDFDEMNQSFDASGSILDDSLEEIVPVDEEALYFEKQIEPIKLLFGLEAAQYYPGRIVKLKLNKNVFDENLLKIYELTTNPNINTNTYLNINSNINSNTNAIPNSNFNTNLLKDVTITIEFQSSSEENALGKHPPKIVSKNRATALEEQLENVSRIFLEDSWKINVKELNTSQIQPKIQTKLNVTKFSQDQTQMHPLLNPKINKKLFRFKEYYNFISKFEGNDHFDDMAIAMIENAFQTYSQDDIKLALSYVISNCNFSKYCRLLTIAERDDLIDLVDNSIFQPNVILELYLYLLLRIPHLNSSCSICDSFINEDLNLPRNTPTICTHFSCLYQYVELGVCSSIPMAIYPSSILTDLRCNPEICDLLISLCYSSVHSNRREILFNPFPTQYVTEGKKNFESVIKSLFLLPSIETMIKAESEQDLKNMLGSKIYDILHFILSTKRKGIIPLGHDRVISEFQTKHQFLLAVDEPMKRKSFEEKKKKFGSYFAFHGTRDDCMHSILRQGLVVASDTPLETTGKLYGSGIYFSPTLKVSMSFAQSSFFPLWNKSKFSTDTYQHVFLCEIVKDPSAGNHEPNPYYVIQSADAVCTRLYLMFKNYKNSIDLTIKSELEEKLLSLLPSH